MFNSQKYNNNNTALPNSHATCELVPCCNYPSIQAIIQFASWASVTAQIIHSPVIVSAYY